MDEKATLHDYLRLRRSDLVAKLDGLGEYDARRPLTPTGTNLAGLVKHVAAVQLGYLGEVFDRPDGAELPFLSDDAEPNADMWLTADESLDWLREFAAHSDAVADATIAALPLDAPGQVPWWGPERGQVTLHQILVHLIAEIARHAGHADILRETLDGSRGNGPADPNLPYESEGEWAQYRQRVEDAARRAASRDVV